MRFIKVWSYSCAAYLAKQLNENHEKRGVYYYGFQVVIGVLVKFVFLIGLSLITGALKPTLIMVLTFAALRILAGGVHMDSYGKCIMLSLVIFIVCGTLVQYTYIYWPYELVAAFIGLSFIFGLFVIIKWAPKDTPNKPITKPEEKRKFKRLSIIYMPVWLAVVCILAVLNLKMYAVASCFGLVLECFMITPLGYNWFTELNEELNYAKGKKA